jgi:hypothetical protein
MLKVARQFVVQASLCSLALAAAESTLAGQPAELAPIAASKPVERQITHNQAGHILTNTGVWSPDGQWVVYDTRSTPAGERFDGERIEMVNVRTGEVRVLYQAQHGAFCGVVTFHPLEQKVVFILGPEFPSPDWQYCAWHRQGVIVDVASPRHAVNLDACNLVHPFTAGALRGGSHVHVWDAPGQWLSFTYEDHVLARFTEENAEHQMNLRNVGVSAPFGPVRVNRQHPRNHDGEEFSVLVTRTVAYPQPGTDEISKACEEGWIGTNGYVRTDGTRQRHAVAFQGQVITPSGKPILEVFVVDLPEDLTIAGEGPLAGTATQRPSPPKGTAQRRLTHTAARKYPGLQGPRHWLRASPDGDRIAFLMKDEEGIVQLWTVSPRGGQETQLTHNPESLASTFTWSPSGKFIAHVMDNSVCITDTRNGNTRRLTQRQEDSTAPRPEACVFSPDNEQIAYVRPVFGEGGFHNQVFVVPALR